MAASKTLRADQMLAERGFFESRTRARQEILAGTVFADGKRIDKPSQPLAADAEISLGTLENPYVSRGGLKLAAALDHFELSPKNLVALDVGASTGGFTHVLLKRGASAVYAVDVGQDQLHATLRSDPKVRVSEKTDIRDVKPSAFDKLPQIAVCDVSFISLRHILPAVLSLMSEKSVLIVLVKPQFELGPKAVGKGGLVKDRQLECTAVQQVVEFFDDHPPWRSLGWMDSPITGGEGNREYFVAAQRGRDHAG